MARTWAGIQARNSKQVTQRGRQTHRGMQMNRTFRDMNTNHAVAEDQNKADATAWEANMGMDT